jgi:two-component system, cell cycle response regulator
MANPDAEYPDDYYKLASYGAVFTPPGNTVASADPVQVSRNVTPFMGVPAHGQPRERILVVDDDDDQAASVAMVLGTKQYDVSIAGTGLAALNAVRISPPGLILLDVNLPDIDGFAVAEELRKDRRTASIPILFVSGAEGLAARVRQQHQVDLDFVRKPYESEELLARVEHTLAETELREQLHRDARFDDLTGLGNLRLFEERIAIEAARVARYGTALSVAMVDLDKLKTINDRYGHPTGSAVLRALGAALLAQVRETDLAIRYGGDEFVVLLPHTHLPDAVIFAERLLARIRGLRPSDIPISVSIGLAAFDKTVDHSARDVVTRADQAVFRAKRAGGDRVEATTS